MNTTLTAIPGAPATDYVMRSSRADARLAPGGRKRRREHDTQVARSPHADQAARWQRILDLLDPGKRCGAWSPATFEGRPVVCTLAPTTAARSTQTPKPGGAGRTGRPSAIPYGSPRAQDTQASDRLSGGCEVPRPGQRRHRDARQRKDSPHMTTIVPEQRTAAGRHRRGLEIILASAPVGAATVVACAVPPPHAGRRCMSTPAPMRLSSSWPGCCSCTLTVRWPRSPRAAWCTSAAACPTHSRRHPAVRRASSCCIPDPT